jgi:hypothetical protein
MGTGWKTEGRLHLELQDTAERERAQDTDERECECERAHAHDTAERERAQERPGGTGGAPAYNNAAGRERRAPRGPERTEHNEKNARAGTAYRCVQPPSGGLSRDETRQFDRIRIPVGVDFLPGCRSVLRHRCCRFCSEWLLCART